ncbi:hypothetical protein DB346_22340 [Verrucomicrobia bacterium LW23]|nr:hypothetical protein DB346_22340 [Verrucomicrobia bacterium LW23]
MTAFASRSSIAVARSLHRCLNATSLALIAAAALACLAPAPAVAQESHLANGDMEAGGDIPDGWRARGEAKLSRDTEIFAPAPKGASAVSNASLRIELSGGNSGGGAMQKLDPAPTGAVHITGTARVEGSLERVQVALQHFDTEWKQAGWKVVASFTPAADGKGEWKDFSATIKDLPANATNVVLVVTGKGTGKIWIDNLVVESGK